MDLYPVDFDDPIGRVRKYIPDLIQLPDPADPDGDKSFIFSDEELQSFIDDETIGSTPQTWEIKRAAAYAMIAMANSENLILKKLVTQDQQTDGPAVARALIAAAAALMARADNDQATATQETFTDIFPAQTHSDNNWPIYRRVWLR